MDFAEYIDLAFVTVREDLKNPTKVTDLACMCALGLCGELVEHEKQPSRNEAGDILWYAAVLYKAFGWEDSPVLTARYSPPFHATGAIAELVKKWAFHGKRPQDIVMKEWVDDVISYVNTVYDLEMTMTQNIDKLKKRYPDGFHGV